MLDTYKIIGNSAVTTWPPFLTAHYFHFESEAA